MPARIVASNLDKFPHLERVAVLVFGVWLLGVVFYHGILRITRAPWAALGASAIFTILLGSGGTLAVWTSTWVACLLAAAIAISFGVLVARFSGDLQRFLVVLITAFALSSPIAGLLSTNELDYGTRDFQELTTPVPEELAHRPDIYVIVLDAFPGDRALSETYGHSIEWPLVDGVSRLDAWANYPVTLASVASLFQMGLPLPDGTVLDKETRSVLAEVVAGDNRFVRTLASHGYRTLLVESGWSRSYCHSSIDLCVPSHFIDEGVFEILYQSVFGEVVAEKYGSGLTSGARSVMSWLQTTLPQLARNDRQDFVFASVILPHPPLMLNEGCEVEYDGWRSGNSLFVREEWTELRIRAFLDQVNCAADFETELLRAVSDDAVVVFISDHGGDSKGQLSSIGRSWSTEDVLERMNVHLAIRMPITCNFVEPIFVSEVLQQVLSCLANRSSTPSPDPPPVFIAERIAEPKILRIVRLDREIIQELGLGHR